MNIKRSMLAFGSAAILLGGSEASAATLTLNAVVVNQQYQQTVNSPCVIGEPSCNNGAFPNPTILGSNDNSFDATSPQYSVQLLRSFFGNTFIVGLDVNQTSVVQQLSIFQMLVNGSVVDEYNVANTPVPPTVGGGNGNGYADYTFTGFTSLAGFLGTDIVTFRAVMPLVNDGREQFFIIDTGDGPCPNGVCPLEPSVPEPTTLALLGLGLLGAGAARRRKQ